MSLTLLLRKSAEFKMPKEDPLDEALFMIEKLITFLEENLYLLVDAKQIASLEAQFNQLEKEIEIFASKTETQLKDAGLKKQDITRLKEGDIPKNISGVNKEILLKSEKLKQRLFKLKDIVAEEKGIAKKPSKEKKEKKNITKREHLKKYKRLGGTDDWKPL